MTPPPRLAFLLILCLAPLSALRGQTFKALYKAAGDTVLQTGASVRALPDGYAAAGIEGGSDPFLGGSDRVFVMRTDASGALVFHSSFSLPGSGLPLQLERTADGGFALLCLLTGDGSCALTRLTSAGAVSWQRRYGTGMDPNHSLAVGLARPAFSETADGGFLLAGTRAGSLTPVLFRADGSGSVQWARDLGSSGFGFGLVPASGLAGQWWTAFYAPGSGPESPGSVSFCRVDGSDGSLTASSSASLPAGVGIAAFFPRSLLAAPDGTLRFTAQTALNDGATAGLAAARLSSSGQILSAQSYGPPSGLLYYPTQAMEPFALSDGGVGIPVLAVDASGAGPYASGLLRLDANLAPTAWRVVAYSASVPEILFGMRQTADGGFAVCGGQIQPNSSGRLDGDALLWRVDAAYASGACALEAGALPAASALSFAAAPSSAFSSPASVFSAGTSPVSSLQTPAVSYACAPSGGGGGGGCPAPSAAAFQPLGPVSVQAGWTAVPAANSYRHRSRAVGASAWGGWKTVSAPSAVLTGLTPSTQYQMEIVARCGANNANNSAVLAASFSTPGPEACAVPSGLTAQAESATAVNLAWDAVSGSTGYRLRWRPAAGGAWTEIPADPANTVKGTARRVGGLSAGTEYEFQARTQCGATILTDWSAPVFASTWFTSAADQLWTRNGAGQMTATLPQSVVGIGHSNPQAALHVGDGTVNGGTVLFSGTSGTVPPPTAGPQLFWAPEKAAFRVGSVDGSQWENANVGLNSIAFGKNATAGGTETYVMGSNVSATGSNSMVFGFGTAGEIGTTDESDAIVQLLGGIAAAKAKGGQVSGDWTDPMELFTVNAGPLAVCSMDDLNPAQGGPLNEATDFVVQNLLATGPKNANITGNIVAEGRVFAGRALFIGTADQGLCDPDDRSQVYRMGRKPWNAEENFGSAYLLHINNEREISDGIESGMSVNALGNVGIHRFNAGENRLMVGADQFVATANGNVGVGTASPTGRFQVNAADLVVSRSNESSGWVGVGTAEPQARLHVIQPFSETTAPSLKLTRVAVAGQNDYSYAMQTDYIGAAALQKAWAITEYPSPTGKETYTVMGDGTVYRKGSLFLTEEDAWVGIGTLTPDERLTVDGNAHILGSIKAEGRVCAQRLNLRMDADDCPWPDYVFENDYRPMSLQELREYLSKNKALPGMATAAEVSRNGIDVGETQTSMLRLLEELYLHVIRLDSELEDCRDK